MKVIFFVTPETRDDDQLSYISDRLEESSINLEIVDVETRDGAGRAEIYDIYKTPAIFVTSDDGVIVRSWTEELPTASDVVNAASI